MATPLALVWDLIARDNASVAFAKVSASADKTAAATGRAAAATEGAGRRMGAALGALAKGSAVVGAVVAVESLKMAGDFQFQMNRMVTAAGESRKNLKQVSDGVLNLMASTGTSAKNLEQGLYLIESAGYHGKAGLDVLTVAAKGAKIENAGLAEVANAVTSAMVDYHLKAADSAAVMNTLIAGVAHGKTTLAEMSLAFSKVGAAGAQANIPMADLTAALATMTMHGTDAATAGTYLRQTIGQLAGGSAKARAVMAGLGLDANKVGLALTSGPGGLANAISMVDGAITSHLQPSGLVAIDIFKKSHGSLSDFQKVLGDLPPSLVTSFSALANMVGGVKSLQGILQLGGENLKTFRANTLAVNDAVKAGGKNVDGWTSTQKQFNVQLAQVRGQIDKWLIQLGAKLIPLVLKAIGWIKEHKKGFQELGQAIERVAVWAYQNLILPVIKALIPVVKSIIGWVHEHRKGLEQLAHVIGDVLVVAIRILVAVFKGVVATIRTVVGWVGDLFKGLSMLGDAFNRIGKATGIIAAWKAMRPIFVEMKSFVDDIKQTMIDIGMIGETVQGHGSLSPALQAQANQRLNDAAGLISHTVKPRAAGGPVLAGHPYLVGEHRPELFVPNMNGYIVPKVPGSHQTVNVNQTIVNPIAEPVSVSSPAAVKRAAIALGR